MPNISDPKREIAKRTKKLDILIPKVVKSGLPELHRIALLLDATDRSWAALQVALNFTSASETVIDAYTIIDPQITTLIGQKGLKYEEQTVIQKINSFIAQSKAPIRLTILRESTLNAMEKIRTAHNYDLLVMPVPYFEFRTENIATITDLGLVCEQFISNCSAPIVVIPTFPIKMDQLRKNIGYIVLDPLDTEFLIKTIIDFKPPLDSQISGYLLLDREYLEKMDIFVTDPKQFQKLVNDGLAIRHVKAEYAYQHLTKYQIQNKTAVLSETVDLSLKEQISGDNVQLLFVCLSSPPATNYRSTRVLDLIVQLENVGAVFFLRFDHKERLDKEAPCERKDDV